MLNVYHHERYIDIGKGYYLLDSFRSCADSENIKGFKDREFTFDELYDYIGNHYVDGIERTRTLITHKPLILVRKPFQFNGMTKIRHSNKTKIRINDVVEEDKNVSLNWIIKCCSAEETVQYLKDRGMNSRPIITQYK